MTAKSTNRANQAEAQATPQTVQGVLQRKCACGQHTLGKSCSACSKDDESVLKRSVNKHAAGSSHVPQIVHDVLLSPGTPLDARARAFMEPRFGRDFSDVRIHTDSRAAESAGAVGALAYTLGKDIVFGSGNYSPHTREGKSLLAHELTHVAQNRSLQRKHSAGISIGPENDHYEAEADRNAHAVARGDSAPMRVGASSSEPGRLSRATMKVGSTNVLIDYSNIIHVKVADYESEIETRFTNWTTSPATAIHTELTALSSAAKEWVLFALDLLVDNPITGLNKVSAVKRLIAYAPSAQYRAVGNPDNNFENEALSVSGWFEKALSSGLTKPTGVKASFVQQRLSTGSGGGSTCPSPRTNALDVAKLKSDMPVQLEAYLNTVQVISNTKNQPMAPLQKLGDAVQERARSYYSPYADHSRGKGNTFVQQWQYSAHMVSSQSAAGTPTTELRVAYLDSRARIVGDKGLFTTVNFDSSCDADNNELEAIVTAMETKSNIQALIDPILRQKSYTNQNVTPKQVIINPQVSATTDDCEARWKTVRTICHELMHVMVHDDFRRAEKGRMIMREGWPEVLGHYLYEDISGDAAMKPKMEDGLANKPCASIPGSTIGYGDAGKKAEEIRIAIKNPNFRAAFFLGQLELAPGIQPKLSTGTSNDPLEHEADRIADRAVSPSGEASAAPHIQNYRSPVTTDLEAPATVNHVLGGSGRPLEPAVRHDMETRLGRDFSRVRVHSDATAAQSARTINAEAYTAGHNIVFGPGKFAPSTDTGRRLLAHELVHVVQQSDSHLVQRKSNSAESDVHSVLRTPGEPLDARTRKFMEPRLGQDFSRVRVHTDERAAQSARAVDALAYTFQNHLVLDDQSLPDQSYARQRVLAHELSHVVQQSRHGEPQGVGISSDVAAETHADNAAQQVMRGHRVNVGDSASNGLMRIPRSAFRSLSPKALSDAEIETEIREIEEYVGSSPLSPETVDHLNLSRNALVDEQQRRKGLPAKAEKSGTTGLAVPTTPAAPATPQPPFYGMKAADNAFHGIQLEYTVDSLPSGGQVEHKFKRGPYLIALNQKTADDGSKRISYYIAYRRKEAVLIGEGGWNEYVIGPDSIEQFLSNMKLYEGVAAGPYAGGPPSAYQAESGKAVQKMMEGDVGGSVRSLGRAWLEAFKDPSWWASVAVSTAGALPGRVPVKAPAPGVKPPTPGLRPIPGGRPGPIPMRVGPGGRPVVASGPKPVPAQAPVAQAGPVVRGGAAPKLAPAPVPEPVPAPAPPVPKAVPDIPKPSAPAPRGSLGPAVGAAGAAGASTAKSPKTSPAPQPKPDETQRRNCMQQNPGAHACDEPLRTGPDMMEETLVDFLLSQTNKDFAPDDLGGCYKFGNPIPAGTIDDCSGAPAIRYHCSVKGDPRTISIFGCLCCDLQGNTHYQWSWPHWSAK